MILKEIEQQIALFEEAMFGHEYKEQNGDAHSLLKAAVGAMFGYLIFVILQTYYMNKAPFNSKKIKQPFSPKIKGNRLTAFKKKNNDLISSTK
jgi:hypothetical protein